MGERKKKRRRKPVGIATVVIPALCDPEAEGAPVPGSGSLGYTVRPYLKTNQPRMCWAMNCVTL